MFKLYSCKLRLGGSVLNEIDKQDVTAPEIEMLRLLHGSDAVLHIRETGQVNRTDRQERARIEQLFASPTQAMGGSLAKKKRAIADLFGHERNPLPKEVEEVIAADEPEEFDDAKDIAPAAEAAPPPKRTRLVKEPSFAE
jgi:hypothetical protein